MNKLFQLILGVCMILGLCACNSTTKEASGTPGKTIQSTSPDIEAQKEIAEQYFTALANGDIETANSLTTDDFEDGFKIKDTYNDLESILDTYGLQDSYGEQIDQVVSMACQKVFQDYSISEDTDQVKANVVAIDISDLESKVKSLAKDYIAKNIVNMATTVISQGKEAAIAQLAPEAVQYVYNNVQEEINNLQYQNYTMTFSFEEVDGTWKISKTEKTAD